MMICDVRNNTVAEINDDSVVLQTAEDNIESAAYEYCDDFEEYTPEQVDDQFHYHNVVYTGSYWEQSLSVNS